MQAKRYCVAVAVVVALGAAWAFSYSAGSVQREPPGRRALGASADAASTELVERSSTGAPESSAAKHRAPESRRRVLARQRADAVRRTAAERRAAAHATPASADPAVPSAPSGAVSAVRSSALGGDEEQRRRDYVKRAVQEQYIPVAKSCYEELLGRDPQAAGKVVLSFAIVGDGDAGVVDRVELKDDTTMQDPEFTLCMRESMYTAVFEAPPPGASETTVEYPLELSP